MRIFVISLPESVERRARIERQLAGQDVPFSFYDAINLQSDRNHYFHHCDEAQFLLNTGRTPTAGELGCFASHLMLWRTCRLLDEPILILEDDAELAADFKEALPFLKHHIRRFGFIRLQQNKKGSKHCIVRQHGRQIDFCSRYSHGSLSYALSPAVADAFIERSSVFQAPVDIFIKRYWQHGQPLFTLSPAIASLSPASRRSTIADRQPARRSVAVTMRRWWRKRCDFVARGLFNLRWLRAEGQRTTLKLARQVRLAGFKSDRQALCVLQRSARTKSDVQNR
ncbi:MAG: glycosyltransferase family 25 protein [Woeseia sp.]